MRAHAGYCNLNLRRAEHTDVILFLPGTRREEPVFLPPHTFCVCMCVCVGGLVNPTLWGQNGNFRNPCHYGDIVLVPIRKKQLINHIKYCFLKMQKSRTFFCDRRFRAIGLVERGKKQVPIKHENTTCVSDSFGSNC